MIVLLLWYILFTRNVLINVNYFLYHLSMPQISLKIFNLLDKQHLIICHFSVLHPPFLSGFVHLLTRRIESFVKDLAGSRNCITWSMVLVFFGFWNSQVMSEWVNGGLTLCQQLGLNPYSGWEQGHGRFVPSRLAPWPSLFIPSLKGLFYPWTHTGASRDDQGINIYITTHFFEESKGIRFFMCRCMITI